MASNRARNFACVVYPESAPENWRDLLIGCFVPAFVSPLHDQDVDPQNQSKKPHYHVMIMFDGLKTNEQVQQVFDLIGGVGCEVVKSIRGYARYLCHLDNPEKAQYSPDEVTCYCGSDYVGTIGLSTDKYHAIQEMMDFVDAHDIVSYSDLLRYSARQRSDWFRILCDNGTLVMKEYLKSKVWMKDRGIEEKIK